MRLHVLRNIGLVVGVIGLLSGCASMLGGQKKEHRTASVVDYLYPHATEAPQLQAGITTLRPPIRVGIAFVPSADSYGSAISEQAKTQLLAQVKSAFSAYDYIGSIEIIPSNYLRPRGSFDNLDQVARMFNVEVVALLSYDQVQFNDTNALAVLYWTVVGAYVIHGDKYDVQTMLDATVFDVASRKLLFRAPGTSRVKGSASMAGFSDSSRAAQISGFDNAVKDLIPQLTTAMNDYKLRLKQDATVRVENKDGYKGGGDIGVLGVLLAMALAVLAYATRRPI